MRGNRPRVKFARVKVSVAGPIARLLALFFIAVLADVPILCPEERPGTASMAEHTTPGIHAVASTAGLLSVIETTSSESDCGCPCHHTFGGPIEITLSTLVPLPEFPGGPVPRGISPPIRSPEHPPQNLA